MMRKIAGEFREQLFSKRKHAGFLLETATAQEINAKFVRRIEREVVIDDPISSRPVKYTATRFLESMFKIQREPGLLLGLNLGPAFRELTGAMVSSTGAGIVIEPISEPPQKLAEVLLQKLSNAKIYGATVASYNVSPEVVARIRFEGGTDLTKIAKRFLKNKFEFSSFRIQFKIGNDVHSCEVRRDRHLVLMGEPHDEVVKAINEVLMFALT
jgi:hypothetical protein